MGIKTEIKKCISRNLNNWKSYLTHDNDHELDITFAVNEDLTEWTYQIGDNSYMGSCYHLPIWAIGIIDSDTKITGLYNHIIDQFKYDDRIEKNYF